METFIQSKFKKVLICLVYSIGLEVVFFIIAAVSVWLIIHSVNSALAECNEKSDLLSDPGLHIILTGGGWFRVRKNGRKIFGKK